MLNSLLNSRTFPLLFKFRYIYSLFLHQNSYRNYVFSHLLTCRVINVCLIRCLKIYQLRGFDWKIYQSYVFCYAIVVVQIENENLHRNHDQGGLTYFRRINILQNRRSRSTALNIKINLQQCFPNRMLTNPAKLFRTTLRRIIQVLLYGGTGQVFLYISL